MRFAIMALLLTAIPVRAQDYPIDIPADCIPLAEREHRPTVLESKTQALKAKARLWAMDRNDPLVARCRDAVRTLEAARKAMNTDIRGGVNQ